MFNWFKKKEAAKKEQPQIRYKKVRKTLEVPILESWVNVELVNKDIIQFKIQGKLNQEPGYERRSLVTGKWTTAYYTVPYDWTIYNLEFIKCSEPDFDDSIRNGLLCWKSQHGTEFKIPLTNILKITVEKPKFEGIKQTVEYSDLEEI